MVVSSPFGAAVGYFTRGTLIDVAALKGVAVLAKDVCLLLNNHITEHKG